MPRTEWMKNISLHIADDFVKIANYAKQTFTSKQDYEEIKSVSEIVGQGLKG